MANPPCVLGKTIGIRGTVSGSEDLAVEGRVEGTMTLAKHLIVEPSGVVEADVDVEDLTVRGSLRGEIRSSHSVTVHSGGRVTGNIRAQRIAIEEGALVNGRIEMDVELPADLSR